MSELVQKKGYIGEGKVVLPNSVDTLTDGSIVVADGGNNRICIFKRNGKLLRSVGGLGFDKYHLKEPVAVAVSPRGKIYVADWHNHRIVVYSDELKYETEFGHYGKVNRANIRGNAVSAIKFYHKLSRSGVYNRYFFSENEEQVKNDSSLLDRIRLWTNGFLYWTFERHPSLFESLRAAIMRGHMHKPNGIAFVDSHLYVTQKNAKCLSVYEETNNGFEFIQFLNAPHNDDRFGRLGNVYASPTTKRLYVCDERNNIIWILNSAGEYIDELRNIGNKTFLPFSCCEIGDNLLAICSAKRFLITSLEDETIEFEEELGELHGVNYDEKNSTLYVVERSNDRLVVYDVCKR